jgi:hypothetical protein
LGVHPPNRGFGKPPRQPADGDGRRPLLQGHLKRAKGGNAAKPALEQTARPEEASPIPEPEPPKVSETDGGS